MVCWMHSKVIDTCTSSLAFSFLNTFSFETATKLYIHIHTMYIVYVSAYRICGVYEFGYACNVEIQTKLHSFG